MLRGVIPGQNRVVRDRPSLAGTSSRRLWMFRGSLARRQPANQLLPPVADRLGLHVQCGPPPRCCRNSPPAMWLASNPDAPTVWQPGRQAAKACSRPACEVRIAPSFYSLVRVASDGGRLAGSRRWPPAARAVEGALNPFSPIRCASLINAATSARLRERMTWIAVRAQV
jgi:hypothetical protein